MPQPPVASSLTARSLPEAGCKARHGARGPKLDASEGSTRVAPSFCGRRSSTAAPCRCDRARLRRESAGSNSRFLVLPLTLLALRRRARSPKMCGHPEAASCLQHARFGRAARTLPRAWSSSCEKRARGRSVFCTSHGPSGRVFSRLSIRTGALLFCIFLRRRVDSVISSPHVADCDNRSAARFATSPG